MKLFALLPVLALATASAFGQGVTDDLRSDARASGVDAQKRANFQRDVLDRMGVKQRLGATLPKDVPFVDQNGQRIVFGDLLGKRPIVIMPMFFECKGVCGVETDSLLKSMIQMKDMSVGVDYDLVLLSIHPKETWELVNPRWKGTVKLYDRPEAADGMHFLTGKLSDIRRITDALGFSFVYDEKENSINHPAGLMVLSSEGKITGYMINKEFPKAFLARYIEEAKQGIVGAKSESVLFGCIMIDRATGARSLVIENVIRLSAAVFALGLGVWITAMSLSGRKRKMNATNGGLA